MKPFYRLVRFFDWFERWKVEHWLPPVVGVIFFLVLCWIKPPWKG